MAGLARVGFLAYLFQTEQDFAAFDRSRPFGDDAWTLQTVRALGLEHTIRQEGRPTPAKGDAETA